MNKKTLLITLISLLLIAGAAFAYISLDNDSGNEAVDQQEPAEINLDPPTDEERDSGDEEKARIAEERERSSDGEIDDKKIDANVIITDANQYDNIVEVRAFISNHIESGTCTYLFTKDSDIVEKSMPAQPDASTTVCPALEVNRSEFPSSGSWSLVVIYESDSARGSSRAKNININ